MTPKGWPADGGTTDPAGFDGVEATEIAGNETIGVGAGTRLGAYRLLEPIGEGGMGQVFRAERADGVFAQQVAVKVTHGSVGERELHRFTTERQILASLHHPNIVSLLDGGAAPTGQAYLVMERVDGAPVTEYCNAHALSLERRLRIFVVVCGAVQYAHQHAVVHRDLKPANILVGPGDVPKVVDFGIAKLVEAPAANGTMTGAAGAPLTPNYASPEQIRGLPATTASDVYALGVILYELTSGTRPYDTEGQTLDRVLDLVVHTDPPRPSAIRQEPHEVPLPYPRVRLRGDLDAIILKALHKDSTHRYASAGALATDVGRFLAGEPVLARAPSALYVLGRLAARHRRLVVVSALALVALIAVSSAALWQWQVARRQQSRAENRFRDVRQLANTLIFKVHDAVAPLAGSTPVRRTIVDEALSYLERLEAESRDDISLRLELAAARRQIASILGHAQQANLGDRDGAITQYEHARRILVPLVHDASPYEVVAGVVDASVKLSTLYSLKGDRDRARVTATEALQYATRYSQREPADRRGMTLVGQGMFQSAWTLPPDDAVPAWLETLRHYERMLDVEPDNPQNQRNVGLVCKYLGSLLDLTNPAAARPHHARAFELDEKRLAQAPENRQVQFDVAISASNLASVSEILGDVEAASQLFSRSLGVRRRLADSDPNDVLARERLGYILGRVARFHAHRDPRAARALALESIEVSTSVFEKTKDRSAHNTLARGWLELARIEQRLTNRPGACAAFRRAATLYTTVAAPTPELAREVEHARAGADACNTRTP
jgi:tetratricopeptide (TPR) repeat protein